MVKPGAEARPLVTWQAGNGRIVEHLVASLSSQARLGIATIEIIPTAAGECSGVDVVALSQDGHTARSFHAERECSSLLRSFWLGISCALIATIRRSIWTRFNMALGWWRTCFSAVAAPSVAFRS